MKHGEPLNPDKCFFCQKEKLHDKKGWRVYLGAWDLVSRERSAKACVPCGKRAHRVMQRLAEMIRRE